MSTSGIGQDIRPAQRTGGARRMGALGLCVVAAIALSVRLYTVRHTDNIARDGAIYLHMAHQLTTEPVSQVLRSYDYHPGYPAAVAAAATALNLTWPGGWIAAGQWISVWASMVVLICLYLVARAAFGSTGALITVLLFALASGFVEISCDVISDAQALAFAMLAVVAGLGAQRLLEAGRKSAVLLAAAAGLCGGLGYLTRPEHLLGAAIAGLLLLTAGRLDRRGRAIQVASIAALLAAALLAVLPYAITIGGLTQKKSLADFVHSGGGTVLAALGGLGGLATAMWRVIDRTREAMGTGVCVLAMVCWITWFGKFVLRLNLPAKVLIGPTRRGAVAMFCAIGVMFPLLTALESARGSPQTRYISTRHALIHGVLLAPFAAAGVMVLANWSVILGRRLGARPRPGLSVAAWTIGVAMIMLPASWSVLHEGKAPYRRAGLDLARRFGTGHNVLGPDSRLAFFAGAPAEQFISRSTLRPSLQPGDAASTESLLSKALGSHDGQSYSFLAFRLSAAEGENPPLVRDVMASGRFEQVGRYELTNARLLHVFRILPAPVSDGLR